MFDPDDPIFIIYKDISYKDFETLVEIGCEKLGMKKPSENDIKKAYKHMLLQSYYEFEDSYKNKVTQNNKLKDDNNKLKDDNKLRRKIVRILPGAALILVSWGCVAAHTLKDPKKIYSPVENIYWDHYSHAKKDPKTQKHLYLNTSLSAKDLPSLTNTAKYINSTVKELVKDTYKKVKENVTDFPVIKIITKNEKKETVGFTIYHLLKIKSNFLIL